MKNRMRLLRETILMIFIFFSYMNRSEAVGHRKEGRKVVFSSAYTDLRLGCKPTSSEKGKAIAHPSISPSFLCAGPRPYNAYIGLSEMGAGILVLEGKNLAQGFSLNLAAQGPDIRLRKVEWRLANGKPFAVIFRRYDYQGRPIELAADKTHSAWDRHYKKAGETLLIKGLKGFEKISFEVIASKQPKATEQARRLADQAYRDSKNVRHVEGSR